DSLRNAMENAIILDRAMESEKNHAAQIDTLLDYSFNAIVRIAPNRKILSVNSRMCDILEAREEELTDKNVQTVFPELRRPDVPLGEFRTRCKLNLTLEEADDLPNKNLRPETMVMVLGGAESALIRGGSKEALDLLDTLFRQPWGAATLQRDDNARELASTLWMRAKVEQRQKEIKSHGDSSGKAAVQQAEAQRQAREAEQARLQAEIQRIFEENERMMREAIEADNRYWQMMNENNRRYWEQETKRISESIKGIEW
ncbi:MAG: hypothetical protein IIW01_01115, partial [Thermoguttaceae bacterium]|nr:hypothetical protein [Thermoguttaceae bacterium]